MDLKKKTNSIIFLSFSSWNEQNERILLKILFPSLLCKWCLIKIKLKQKNILWIKTHLIIKHYYNLCHWPKCELVTQLIFPSKPFFNNLIKFPMKKYFKFNISLNFRSIFLKSASLNPTHQRLSNNTKNKPQRSPIIFCL